MTGRAAVSQASHMSAALNVERIALRRFVLDWRDHWMIEAEIRLRRACEDARPAIAAAVATLPLMDLLLGRATFIEKSALPLAAGPADAEIKRIVEEAQTALSALIVHHHEVSTKVADAAAAKGMAPDQMIALGRGLAPIAAAVGIAAVLPGAAVMTNTAMLGLVTVSTVSMPVLALGIGGAAVLAATGAVNLADLRAGEERKLHERIDAAIEERILSPLAEVAGGSSLLAQRQRDFMATAETLIGEAK